jgi:uncharacterized membrane protein (UPF0127 family)
MKNNVSVSIQGKATVIGHQIAVADSSATRFLGLMGKRSIDSDSGLWIIPSSGVHTCWMRMNIDVVALDKMHRVIGLGHSVPPWRLSGLSSKTRSVLELSAGRIQACGIELGDVLVIRKLRVTEA